MQTYSENIIMLQHSLLNYPQYPVKSIALRCLGYKKLFGLSEKEMYICNLKNLGIVRWCNGSTTDFGSVCPGSNPGRTT